MTTDAFALSPTAARYDRIARALDNLPDTANAETRARVYLAIVQPTTEHWRAARKLRVTPATDSFNHGMSLWRLLLEVHKPTPGQSVQTPTGEQIIYALNRARSFQ